MPSTSSCLSSSKAPRRVPGTAKQQPILVPLSPTRPHSRGQGLVLSCPASQLPSQHATRRYPHSTCRWNGAPLWKGPFPKTNIPAVHKIYTLLCFYSCKTFSEPTDRAPGRAPQEDAHLPLSLQVYPEGRTTPLPRIPLRWSYGFRDGLIPKTPSQGHLGPLSPSPNL